MGQSRYTPDYSGGGGGGLPTFIYKITRTLRERLTLSILLTESHTMYERFRLSSIVLEQQFKKVMFFIQIAVVIVQERRSNKESFTLVSSVQEYETKRESIIITVVFNIPGAFTFTVPAGVTSLSCSLWGGGGGSSSATTYGSGGGGGGAFSRKNTISVTPGQVINGNVGPTGAPASIITSDSWFVSTSVALAKGGSVGQSATALAGGAGGVGGAAASGIGDILYSGGTGGTGALTAGGAGGGGAGTTGNGGNASGAVAGTGTPINGGDGSIGGTATVSPLPGSNYGGGAGGAGAAVGTAASGAQGLVTVTYQI